MIRLFLFLTWTILLSCTRTDHSNSSATVENSLFKPHPKPVAHHDVVPLAIGAQAPDFHLPDVTGKFYKLNDFSQNKALVIVFTCNHCPTAQAYEDRLIKFTDEYQKKGVAVVAIMPNSTMALLPEECGYTDVNDSYEEMQIRAKDKSFNFPYLYDGDDQAVSITYGPDATPQAFVFDEDQKLRYVGRLDSLEKPGLANAEDLRNAVDAVISDKGIGKPIQKSFGCSVKWGWKTDWGKKVEQEWKARPVTLEKLDISGIKALMGNPTKKLRLINLWATWCAPCVAEYPQLVLLQRMYGQRDFEFISLSTDKPDKYDKALSFLKEKYSPVRNVLYDGNDNYKLIEAIDPKWNGALPYTLLVEPGGNIVYRYQGPVDLLALKKAIVEHPMIGRYY